MWGNRPFLGGCIFFLTTNAARQTALPSATTMLKIEELSAFYKETLKFFKNNPNAVISAGWSADGFELYIDAEGDAYWAHRTDDEGDAPLVVWNPKNFSPSYSKEGEDGERWFANRLRYFIADVLSREGYSHEAVLWACHNLLADDGEIIPTATRQERQRTRRRRRASSGETPASVAVSVETVNAADWFAEPVSEV